MSGSAECVPDILRAAVTVFHRKGFHATSLEDISVEAALSHEETEAQFPDKEALFEALLERHLRPVREVLDVPAEFMAAFVPANMKNRSYDVVVRILEVALEHREVTSLFLREAPSAGPRFSSKVDELIADACELLSELSEVLATRGWLRPVDGLAFALVVVGALRETLLYELNRPTRRTPQQMVRDMAFVVLDGAGSDLLCAREGAPAS